MKWILILALGMMSSSLLAKSSDHAYDMMNKVKNNVYFLDKRDAKGVTISFGTGFRLLDSKGKTRYITAGHICENTPDATIYVNNIVKGKKNTLGKVKKFKTSLTDDLCELDIQWNSPIHTLSIKGLKLAKQAKREHYVYIVGFPAMPFMTSTWGRLKGVQNIHIAAPHISSSECLKLSKFHHHGMTCYTKFDTFSATAPTQGGGSGSPLLNESGEVIAVVIAAQTGLNWSSSTTMKALKNFLATP